MHLVISKKFIHQETTPLSSRELDNPYVFKPKSYSTKRNANQDTLDKLPRSNPTKKVKKDLTSFK